MKSGKAYRFNLSWGIDTEDKILAGELLERLKHKKNAFVIQLIADFISKNPDVTDKDNTIKFVIDSNSKSPEDIIKEMVKVELENGKYIVPPKKAGTNVVADTGIETVGGNGGVAAMLGNILETWD